MTSINNDPIIFKRSEEESRIFKNFKRYDCFLEILRPNLGRYLINDAKIHQAYACVKELLLNRNLAAAKEQMAEIRAMIGSTFRPIDILEQYMNGDIDSAPLTLQVRKMKTSQG